MAISPLRLLAIGLPAEDVATLYGISLEELDLLAEEVEFRRRCEPPPAGKTLIGKSAMTRLLLRPEMDRWETKRAER